ncbi:hypothetical protein [Deinococcus xianganensis]|uniref:Uncharacterized protein n=1 Tax=Deinococcus xianganensis TaxID=1507289 RepID=A0A6I4YM30_9DEIO|nr:hypothetical protein [Deinococcus xianganensis]MXV20864.1 hypothetical protein [Deinococcus xianganensis]
MRRISLLMVGVLFTSPLALAVDSGRVTQNATQIFTLDTLENGRGQLTASSEYQVVIEFPRDVESVAVTISKQGALTPTAGGRFVYLDVVQPGGNATLNVVLTGNRLVQFDVALTTRADGITRYRVVNPEELQPVATAPAVLPVATTPAPAPALATTDLPMQKFSANGVDAQYTVRVEGQEAVVTYALTYSGTDTVFVSPANLVLTGPAGTTLPVKVETTPESSLLLARVPFTGRVRVTLPAGVTDLSAAWTLRTLLSKEPLTVTAKLAVTR